MRFPSEPGRRRKVNGSYIIEEVKEMGGGEEEMEGVRRRGEERASEVTFHLYII